MLYPRKTNLSHGEVLVEDSQCVDYKEHMSREHRILYLSGVITGETDSRHLLQALDSLSRDPVKIFITSPGGDLDSTFLFYDTMKMIQSPIITVGEYCASAAAILLASGSKRYLYPHAKVMLHLPAGQMSGDAKEWDIQHKQMETYREKIVEILLSCGVKKNRAEILNDIDRDFWLEPKEAISYGLADAILTPEIWREWIK